MVDSSLNQRTTLHSNRIQQFKILILGEAGVGKTSLKIRYTDNTFDENKESTTGIDFKLKEIDIDNNIVKLSIWDTAGSERYHSITRNYLNNAQGILLCFDITSRPSFDELLNYWKGLISEFIEEKGENDLPRLVYLVGTKSDLDNDDYNRQVTYDEADQLASKLQGEYYETSSKTGNGVNDVFIDLATNLFNKSTYEPNTKKKRFTMNSYDKNEEHKSNCCSVKGS